MPPLFVFGVACSFTLWLIWGKLFFCNLTRSYLCRLIHDVPTRETLWKFDFWTNAIFFTSCIRRHHPDQHSIYAGWLKSGGSVRVLLRSLKCLFAESDGFMLQFTAGYGSGSVGFGRSVLRAGPPYPRGAALMWMKYWKTCFWNNELKRVLGRLLPNLQNFRKDLRKSWWNIEKSWWKLWKSIHIDHEYDHLWISFIAI